MKCEVCGREIEKSNYATKVLCSHKCFLEDFWNNCLNEEAIIIDGVCYHAFDEKPDGYNGFLGYGGKRYYILKNNGDFFTTNDLWCNGDVPEERNIKDNAQFITESEYKNLLSREVM